MLALNRIQPRRKSKQFEPATLGLNIAQAEIAIGIAGYSQPDDNDLRNALLMPFRKQRDNWRRLDGTAVERPALASRQPSSYLTE
jgi:hypothetical protein